MAVFDWAISWSTLTAWSTFRIRLVLHVIPWSTKDVRSKGPATRNDFVNDIVNDARADAIFATLKAIVDDEKSTISSTISLRVAWPKCL